jgi:hypothetical protein
VLQSTTLQRRRERMAIEALPAAMVNPELRARSTGWRDWKPQEGRKDE